LFLNGVKKDDSTHATITLIVNTSHVGVLNVEKDSFTRLVQIIYAQMRNVHSEKPDVQAVKRGI
jgi:hypothetical protein